MQTPPNYWIAPSILSADFARLGEEITNVLAAGADLIHLDVMDNHYVPNLTMGPMVCAAIRKYGITAPIDVHLMTSPVDSLIIEFAKAGATTISFHPEASRHIDRSLNLIREQGCKAGLAFNPATPLTCLPYLLDKIDQILIMSVNPGFGGQHFIPSALKKIQEARSLIDQSTNQSSQPSSNSIHPIRLAVDGGVNAENIGALAQAGADLFIAGSFIFNSTNYQQRIMQLRAQLC